MKEYEQLVIVRTDLEETGGYTAALVATAASAWIRERLLEKNTPDYLGIFVESTATLTEAEFAFIESGHTPLVCHARDAQHLAQVEGIAERMGMFLGANWFRIGCPGPDRTICLPKGLHDIAAIGFCPLPHSQVKILSRKYALLKGL